MPMASDFLTWATEELQNYRVIYKIDSEFSDLGHWRITKLQCNL